VSMLSLPRLSRSGLLGLLAASALTLAACGNGAESTSASEDQTAGDTTESAPSEGTNTPATETGPTETGETNTPPAEQTAPAASGEQKSGRLQFGREADIVMGDPNAPVEIIEYASTTCPHCASYKIQVFPKVKEELIDTGIAKYTLREFPTSPAALSTAAFMVARCVPEERYYAVIEAFFRTQRAWAFEQDGAARRDNFFALARRAGLNEEQVNACLDDKAEQDRINASAQEAYNTFGVTGTPAFFVNGEQVPLSIAGQPDTFIKHVKDRAPSALVEKVEAEKAKEAEDPAEGGETQE